MSLAPDGAAAPLPTWDADARPRIEPYEPSAAERAAGDRLRQVHEIYRTGLEQVAAVLDTCVAGTADAGDLRAALHAVGLRQAYQQLGSFCGQICRAVDTHHRIEDAYLYPALRAAEAARLDDVLDRLHDEHEVVHEVLERLDDAARRFAVDPATLPEVEETFTHLRGLLESHFTYEEEQIGDALGVHRIGV